MQLQQKHIDALVRAEAQMFHSDFCPYLELKQLLHDTSPDARSRFRTLFTNYYGLNVGGLTDGFKDRFFEFLFGNEMIVKGHPNFQTILIELNKIPRKKGDYAMPFSFVSKLVAIHHETSPIYDRHVLAFFGRKAPAASVPKEDRISWYMSFLNQVAADYMTWARDARITPILDRFKERDQGLKNCHVVRLLDFLVWKVGAQKLLPKGQSTNAPQSSAPNLKVSTQKTVKSARTLLKVGSSAFTSFWDCLVKGGVTKEGDEFKVVRGDTLNIQSPRNKNRAFNILKKTVEKYVCNDIPNMTESEFRLKRSAYFYNVYNHVKRTCWQPSKSLNATP